MTPYTKENEETDVVEELNCKGKFIYLVLDQGKEMHNAETDNDYQRSIWITLGMTGNFVNEEAATPTKPVASNSDRVRSSGPRWYMELVDTQTNDSRKIYYK